MVCLKILIRENLFSGKKENWDEINHTIKFSKGTWHHIKIRERKGPSRGVIRSPVRPQVCGEDTKRNFSYVLLSVPFVFFNVSNAWNDHLSVIPVLRVSSSFVHCCLLVLRKILFV